MSYQSKLEVGNKYVKWLHCQLKYNKMVPQSIDTQSSESSNSTSKENSQLKIVIIMMVILIVIKQ